MAHDAHDVRPWDSVGTWTVKAKDAALARMPPTGTGEYGDWNGDQVPPAIDHLRQIVPQLGI